MLYTENLSETIGFYTNILGFECVELNTDWGWCALAHGEIDLMFAVPNEHMPYDKIGCSGSFYIHPENVDAVWEQLREITNVAYGIENFEHGMREFAIYDNNGYLLQFGNEITN